MRCAGQQRTCAFATNDPFAQLRAATAPSRENDGPIKLFHLQHLRRFLHGVALRSLGKVFAIGILMVFRRIETRTSGCLRPTVRG